MLGLVWTKLFRSLNIEKGIGGVYLTANLFQLPLPRSTRLDSVPRASNLIHLLKTDTTCCIACRSHFNVAKFEKKKKGICHYTNLDMLNNIRVLIFNALHKMTIKSV